MQVGTYIVVYLGRATIRYLNLIYIKNKGPCRRGDQTAANLFTKCTDTNPCLQVLGCNMNEEVGILRIKSSSKWLALTV